MRSDVIVSIAPHKKVFETESGENHDGNLILMIFRNSGFLSAFDNFAEENSQETKRKKHPLSVKKKLKKTRVFIADILTDVIGVFSHSLSLSPS